MFIIINYQYIYIYIYTLIIDNDKEITNLLRQVSRYQNPQVVM